MIYVTGDTYGDINRFRKSKVRLKKNDTVIVCGNFGFFCDNDKLAQKSLRWLSKQKYTVAFLHGAIDGIDWLNSLPLEDWHAGKAARAYENIYWLPQGEVYEIEGKKIFCFGGGENMDYLGQGYSDDFYTSGLLTDKLIQKAKQNLALHGNKVDYFITHDAPSKLRIIMQQRKGSDAPLCTAFHKFLDELWQENSFSGWFFGKYKENHTIAPIYHCVWDTFHTLTPKHKK